MIPRIGMEVVVEFLEGDPDKPLVTECVYNGKNRVPYALPEHKTRSTFRTKSHGSWGFNELRFEDKRGEEEIFIHAEKDRNEKTLNNHTERIDNNWVQSIGGFKTKEIASSSSEVVGVSKNVVVGRGATVARMSQLLGMSKEGISAAATLAGLKKFFFPPAGTYNVLVERAMSISIGGVYHAMSGILMSMRSRTITLDAAERVSLDAGRLADIRSDKNV